MPGTALIAGVSVAPSIPALRTLLAAQIEVALLSFLGHTNLHCVQNGFGCRNVLLIKVPKSSQANTRSIMVGRVRPTNIPASPLKDPHDRQILINRIVLAVRQ